jgi:hypothetical protein
MRADIDQAIITLDNAKIEFSSPTLASGEINYVSITPNFSDKLDSLCILGFFQIGEDALNQTEPIQIDHIENFKDPAADNAAAPVSTRIYFRAPLLTDFDVANKDVLWKFWARHQPVELRFAAFQFEDGKKTKTYFGHRTPVSISHTRASMMSALLFAMGAYVLAALSVTRRTQAKLEKSKSLLSGFRIFVKRLTPWYVIGTSGQASLSQLQMFAFTIIVSTLLFYQWMRTGLLQEISTDLLYLIGISTVGAVGTEVTKTIKLSLDQPVYDYAQGLGWFAAPMAGALFTAKPSQLLLTNDRFDIYKFQMLLFTVVIAAYVVACGGSQLGNIHISTTLLSLMGMSQGTYMVGRATSDILTPLQDTLRSMQVLQNQYNAAETSDSDRTLLAVRFNDAAKQAAEMFMRLFNREIPDDLMMVPKKSSPLLTVTSVTVVAEAPAPA